MTLIKSNEFLTKESMALFYTDIFTIDLDMIAADMLIEEERFDVLGTSTFI